MEAFCIHEFGSGMICHLGSISMGICNLDLDHALIFCLVVGLGTNSLFFPRFRPRGKWQRQSGLYMLIWNLMVHDVLVTRARMKSLQETG